VFAFLTTEPNAVVAPIHPKAMPVILTNDEDIDVWRRRRRLWLFKRPLADDAVKVVARGMRRDDGSMGPA
jgi:putative SOS response-associated peptidase YedK